MTDSTERVLASIDEILDGYVSEDRTVSDDAMRWRPEEPEQQMVRAYIAPVGTPLDAEPSAWTNVGYASSEGGHDVFQPSDWCQNTPVMWRNQWPNAWAQERERIGFVPRFDPESARRMLEPLGAMIRHLNRTVAQTHVHLVPLTYAERYRRHRARCRLCNPAGNPKPLRVNGAEYRRRRRSKRRRNRR